MGRGQGAYRSVYLTASEDERLELVRQEQGLQRNVLIRLAVRDLVGLDTPPWFAELKTTYRKDAP